MRRGSLMSLPDLRLRAALSSDRAQVVSVDAAGNWSVSRLKASVKSSLNDKFSTQVRILLLKLEFAQRDREIEQQTQMEMQKKTALRRRDRQGMSSHRCGGSFINR